MSRKRSRKPSSRAPAPTQRARDPLPDDIARLAAQAPFAVLGDDGFTFASRSAGSAYAQSSRASDVEREESITLADIANSLPSAVLRWCLVISAIAKARSAMQDDLRPVYGAVASRHRFATRMGAALTIIILFSMIGPRRPTMTGSLIAGAAMLIAAGPKLAQQLHEHSDALGATRGAAVTVACTIWPAAALVGWAIKTMGPLGWKDRRTRGMLIAVIASYCVEAASHKRDVAVVSLLASSVLFVDWRSRSRRLSPMIYAGLAVTLLLAPSLREPQLHLPMAIESRVLARRTSVTGRISVLEHQITPEHMIRVLRADHSLLGGIWLSAAREQTRALLSDEERQRLGDEEIERRSIVSADSIYSAFLLQGAMTLVERSVPPVSDVLIIGLGIGEVAKGLPADRFRLTVVEIDPAVYDYAREYFGFVEPAGGAYLEDARAYLRRETNRFDLIVHDVFTGGSVPPALFTRECWLDVRRHLVADGVLAVNFAGTLDSDAARTILATLLGVFPNCRAFEDQPDERKRTASDFRNMVLFCTPGSDPPTLRTPTKADALGSARRFEILAALPEREVSLDGFRNAAPILLDANATALERMNEGAALEHWRVMREVLPQSTWLRW